MQEWGGSCRGGVGLLVHAGVRLGGVGHAGVGWGGVSHEGVGRVGHVGWGGSYRGGVGYVGWGGVAYVGWVGWVIVSQRSLKVGLDFFAELRQFDINKNLLNSAAN